MRSEHPRGGSLTEPIKIYQTVETQNTSGQPIKTYSLVAREWAAVESNLRVEDFIADRTVGFTMRQFTIRSFTGLTNKHVIEHDDIKYNILGIEELGNHRQWMRVTGEVVNV